MSEKIKLSKLAEINMGQSPKSEFYTINNEFIPFLQGNRTFGYKTPYFDTYCTKPTKIATAGSVIMSVRAPVGDLNVLPADVCIGRGVCELKAHDGDNQYLYYVLLANQERLSKKGNGSIFNAINKDELSNVEINVPSLKKRDYFTNSLKILDDKYELNLRLQTELDEFAQLMFRKWFVDLNFPDNSGNSYKDAGGELLKVNGRFIPKGWDYGFITSIGEIMAGGTPSSSHNEYFSEKGIPWLTPKDLSDKPSMYTERGERDISELGLKNSSAVLLPGRSVLMSSRAPVGYLTISKNPIATNQGFKSIVPYDERYAEFIYYSLRNIMTKILLSSSGSTFSEISKGMMEKLEIIIPEKSVVIKFYETLNPLFEKIDAISLEQELLRNMRDLLIKKLIR